MRVQSENRQLYIKDFVNGLSRERYIWQPIQDKENWREVGKYNQYKIDNQTVIFPKYLQDQLIADHLNEKYIVGLKISKTKKTNRIILDIDKLEQVEIAFKLMFEITQKEKPDILFTSSFRNHLHAYYMFNGYLNETDLNTLKRHLKGVEVYPGNNGIRLPLSRGSFWLDSNFTPQYIDNKNASISELHSHITQGISFTDTSEFRAILSDLNRKERDILTRAKAKLYTSDLPGEFWQRVNKLKTVGLTESGTRNKAHLDIIADCVLKGLSKSETAEYCKEWHFLHTNGLSNDVRKGNWIQIERESIAGYNKLIKTYDPLKAKRKRVKLSISDYKQIYKTVKTLKLGTKHNRAKKAKEVLTNISKLCKTRESSEVYISYKLWGMFGDTKGVIKRILLESGLIEIIANPFITPINEPVGLPTKYRVKFFHT